MGRGTRSHVATTLARSPNALLLEATALADAICLSEDWQDDIERLNLEAQASKDGPTRTAARGGRLIIAVNDIFEAERLAHSSNPADQQIARAMLDSSINHLGRIIASADPDSEILPKLGEAVANYQQSQGMAQIEDLESRGLISSDQSKGLADNIEQLQQQAYASAESRPQWLAVPFMQRAAAAEEQLKLARQGIPDDHPMAAIIDRSLQDCDKVIKGSKKWLDDPQKGGNLRLNAPGQLIKAEAVVASIQDPRTRQINAELGDAVASNRSLVASVAEVPEKPVFAVADSRWLDLSMNHQMMVTGPTSNTLALANNHAIWLSPDIAEDAVVAHSQGKLSPTLVHELVHTSQNQAPIKPLADKGRPRPGQIYDRHRSFESKLTEGATQGLTNHLVGQKQSISREEYYPAYTALVDEVCARTPDANNFYRELSLRPDNGRAAYLFESLYGGKAGEAEIRQITDKLLPLCDRAETDGLGYQAARDLFAKALSEPR